MVVAVLFGKAMSMILWVVISIAPPISLELFELFTIPLKSKPQLVRGFEHDDTRQ